MPAPSAAPWGNRLYGDRGDDLAVRDELVSRAAVISVALWAFSGALVVLVWALAVGDDEDAIGRAATMTGMLTMAVAIVWSIRMYVMRLAAMIRSIHGLDSRPEVELHAVRGGQGTV